MDGTLSEFIVRTSAEPGLARDLLNAHDWNLQSALSAFYVMKGLLPGEVPSRRGSFASRSNSASQRKKSFSKEDSCNPSSPNIKPDKIIEEKKDQREEACYKKLTRGFSRANDNLNIISQARTEFAQDFDSLSQETRCPSSKIEIPDYTFTLPNITAYPAPLQKYLQQDLIEMATLISLKQAGRLNWWYQKSICQELWPLATTGDGNCLLHAASLGIWGFHDRLLTLRRALHNLLTSSAYTNAFYRRWRWQTAMQNKESGLIYSEDEWEREWENLLKISSTEPRTKYAEFKSSSLENSMSGGQKKSDEKLSDVYESLEELHVFILAHVLRRPVVVIADTMLRDMKGEPFAPIPFGGIYLPLEYPPSECHRSPLCLAYDSAHFSALVPMDSTNDKGSDADEDDEVISKKLPTAVPVTDPENRLLHVHFAVDPGSEVKWGIDENDEAVVSRLSIEEEDKLLLLHDYLDIRTFPVPAIGRNADSKAASKNSAKSTLSSEFDYDSDNSFTGSGVSCTGSKSHKSKAARQLQTVAKQFGSIGKSVSKKLKHIGEIARHRSFKGEARAFKLVSNNNSREKRVANGSSMVSCTYISNLTSSDQVVIALLHTKKQHEYQKQMINNYLNSVVSRFEKENEQKTNGIPSSGKNHSMQPCSFQLKCNNPSCYESGSISTNGLCKVCHEKNQKELEFLRRIASSQQSNKQFSECPVFTFGKSSFYTEIGSKNGADASHKLPLSRQLSEKSIVRWDGSSFCGKPAISGVHPSTFNRVSVRL